MKKASSSFLVLFLLLLLCSITAHAQVYQDQNRITERVQQTIRLQDRLRLSELLRLSYQEESQIEIISLSVQAQSAQGQSQLSLTQNGRAIVSEVVRKQLKEIKFTLPPRLIAQGLELSAQSEIYLESITAEVSFARRPDVPSPRPIPGPQYPQQPAPNSLLTLSVNQSVRGYAAISLTELARRQYGIALEGVQVERVVVQGQPITYGRAASVQVELNRRIIGQPKYLSAAQKQTPIPVQSLEEVRSLSLIVNGDAQISEIRIRVGQVRPQYPEYPEYPRTERFMVGREVQARYFLELAQFLPYEQRLVRSITIEARSPHYAQSDLSLSSVYGGIEGTLYLGRNPLRQTITLRRPVSARELRFQSSTVAFIESVEIEFEQYPRY